MYRGSGLGAKLSAVPPRELSLGASFKSGIVEPTIKIVTQGRFSGLPHVVRLRFILRDGSFYVLGGKRKSDWVLNALKAGTVKVRLSDLVITTAVYAASEEESERTLAGFVTKYGSRVVRDWYSNAPRALRLTPQGPVAYRAAMKGEGETTGTYEGWLSQGKEYYGSVSEAFDSASEEYDFTISHNYINTWIRKRSISELLALVKPDDTLIEVGCGTGAETLDISKHVCRIIATDISESMIAILNKKMHARGAFGKIIALQLRAADIGRVEGYLNGKGAHAIYSFNGALNCEPDLEDFAESLSSILAPGGYFVCSVRNSICIGEALSHAVVLQLEKMAPRKRQPVMVSVGGMDIPAFYYSPSAFAEFFLPKLKLQKVVGLPAFLPPAYLSDYYVKFRKVASVLERFEYAFGDRFPFNRLGDQTLFVFQNS
jgi:SAM-dependent methyltransferase